MRFTYFVPAVVIVAALILTLPVFDSSREDFSTYNTDWNGCSQLKALSSNDQNVSRPVFVVRSLDQLNGTSGGLLVMLNPSKNLTDNEIAATNAFVENGGALFLANDFGGANVVLAGMGVDQVRFNGTLLRDDANNWWSSEYPVVFQFATSNMTNGVGTVYLNYPTALDLSNDAARANVTVLAESSPSSYIGEAPLQTPGQLPGNGSEYGGRPVLAYLTHGKGSIVLWSDPSIFINFMVEKGDNERLYTNLLTNLTGGDAGVPVYFDESYKVVDSFWATTYYKINTSDLAKYGFILSLTGVFVAGVGISRLSKKRERPEGTASKVELSERDVVDDMLRRHPRWSRSRLELLLRNIRTRGKR